jgi:hypothetical protein
MNNKDSNATFITSTVIIRVTPQQNHLVSWSILWSCFFVAASFGAWQVWKEYQLLAILQHQELQLSSSNSTTRNSGRQPHQHHHSDVESQAAINEAGVSTADLTRCMVCFIIFFFFFFSHVDLYSLDTLASRCYLGANRFFVQSV